LVWPEGHGCEKFVINQNHPWVGICL